MALDPNDFQDLVGQFVRGSIRRPLDALGVRRTDVSFTDTQEAAAGMFLLYPQAPFYVLYLACQRLLEQVENQAELLDELQRLISSTGRMVHPIKDLTPLNNITSALFELERAIGQRQEAFQDIEQVPAFKRFDENVRRFLEASGRNVKDGGEIVDTPQEARSKIPNLITLMEETHLELVRRVELIEGGLANYEEVNLPALAAAGVIARSREVIQARTASMSSLSPIDRLLENKDAVLELVASRALVRQFSSFARPVSVFPGNITATAFSDPAFPANQAYIEADLTYYYPRDGYNILDFFLDEPVSAKFDGTANLAITGVYKMSVTAVGMFGSVTPGDVVYIRSGDLIQTRWTVYAATADTLQCSGAVDPVTAAAVSIMVFRAPDESIQLINAMGARIDGLAPEPLTFRKPASEEPYNYKFTFSFNGVVRDSVHAVAAGTLTVGWGPYNTGSPMPMNQFIAYLNDEMVTAYGAITVRFEPFFYPAKYDAEMVITETAPDQYRATVISGDLDSLSILDTGWYIRFVTGENKERMFIVTGVGSSPTTYIDFEKPHSGYESDPIALGNARIQLGTKPKIRIYRNDVLASMQDEIPIIVDLDETVSAFPTLGISQGRYSTAGPIKSRVIAKDIVGKGTNVSASTIFQSRGVPSPSLAHSDPLAPTRIVIYKLRGVGDVVASGFDVVVSVDANLVDTSSLEVNDKLVLRTSNPTNSTFDITSWTETTISATGTVGVATQTGVEFEIGDKDLPLDRLMTIYIDEGPNSGTYDVTGFGPTRLDYTVSPLLPIRQDARRQPMFFEVRLGVDVLRLHSTTELVSSSITVAGSAASQFFLSFPSSQGGGTTQYLLLTAVPTGLQIGDYLEYYEDDYTTPTETYTIEEIDFDAGVIKLDGAVPSTRVIEISQNKTVPFGLLRVKQVLSTNGLEVKLKEWRERSQNLSSFFTDLNRFINPLLVNDNPTAVQVSDAIAKVQEQYKYLTEAAATEYGGTVTETLESILSSYNVEHQPPIDTLIKSFKEKGADRAVDILLEASFTGFFGLDADSSSYAGDMLAKLRELAREDLPIRKGGRLEAQNQQLLAQSVDEDFETSDSDTDVPKVPTG